MPDLPLAEARHLTVAFHDPQALQVLCGERDLHLRWLERRLGVEIVARGAEMLLRGDHDAVGHASEALASLYARARSGAALDSDDLDDAVRAAEASSRASTAGWPQTPRSQRPVAAWTRTGHGQGATVSPLRTGPAMAPRPRALGKPDDGEWLDGARLVQPRSDGQRRYVEAIRNHDLTFGIGPAGSGKTWLAVASALAALQRHEVKRIVLTRPAVEAGEHLGFLPGDLREKVSPYLRPLYDAMGDLVDADKIERMIERGQIEAAPLAFMRGRTLNNAFVIVDEAQNCTAEQLLMVMTRLGAHTRMVISGDPSQSDLPRRGMSGLERAVRVLQDVDGVAVVRLDGTDIVRHPLVGRIVQAWQDAADEP
jgi:phosphate starvation-inducible PhoH-like protein